MDKEVWKDIEGFEGLYKISSLGRVYSLSRTSSNGTPIEGHYMCIADNGNGYKWVCLWKDGNSYYRYVHRLVAAAFIPNPNKLPEINHKDEDTANNRVDNLEWCDRRYNILYGTARQRSRATKIAQGDNMAVDKYDMNGNLIKSYVCSLDMEKDGINRRQAINCCYGRTRSYKGFVYRFHGDPFSYREARASGAKVAIRKFDSNGKEVAAYPSIVAAEKANGFNRNYLYMMSYAWSKDAVIDGFTYKRA